MIFSCKNRYIASLDLKLKLLSATSCNNSCQIELRVLSCTLTYITKCYSWPEIFGKTPEPATRWTTRRYVSAGLQISESDSTHSNTLIHFDLAKTLYDLAKGTHQNAKFQTFGSSHNI